MTQQRYIHIAFEIKCLTIFNKDWKNLTEGWCKFEE
jgi:hypothetical protein